MQDTATPPGKTTLDRRLEEAARYALLRRLTPALRHHMIGALQPIGMLAAMLERRAQAAAPDLPGIQKKSADMGVLSREATASCVGLVNWIAPKQADNVSVADGVKECLGVLETDLALRGFSFVFDESPDAAAMVPRAVMRNVFSAALLALTDGASKPSEVTLKVSQSGANVLMSLGAQPRDAQDMGIGGSSYRALEWEDVEALARAESAVLEHSDSSASLRCATA